MPWCKGCSRFVDVPADGSPEQCPACGAGVGPEAAEPAAPWHFKLLVVATAAYLGFRAVQGVVWLIARL